MKTVDHYEYWNKTRKKKTKLLDREIVSLRILNTVLKEPAGKSFLDAGCGNGDFMKIVQKKFTGAEVKGLDYSPSEVSEARKQGLDVERADFEAGAKLKKESFNAIYAGEVIEHLYNTDFFLEQMNFALKNDGYLLITTPNLCAWYNRFLMLLGIQPLFLEMSTRSKLIGSGIMGKFKQGSQPVGHIRIFTLQALKDLLEANGFKVVEVRGAIYDEGFPPSLWNIDRIFNLIPTLASHFVVLAKKVK